MPKEVVMPNATSVFPGGLPNGATPQAILAAAIPGMIVGLVFLVFFLWVYGRILHKAGYSGWLALLTLIPLVNIIFIVWFAFATWPLERRVGAMAAPQAPAGYYPPQPPAQPTAPMQQSGYGAPVQQPGYGAPQPTVPQPPVPQPQQPAPQEQQPAQQPQQPVGYGPPPQQ